MADVARLSVDLQLKGDFNRGITDAQRKLKGFTGEANKTQGMLGRMRSSLRSPELKNSLLQGVGLGGGLLGFQALTVGIGATVNAVGDAISAASDLTESQSKVDAVFDTQARTIRRWAQDLDSSFGLTERAALESAGTIGNFLQALGQTEDFAAEASRGITELAGDLSSFNNIPVGDVLVALRSGLAGESEPVRRLGIDISAARIEALLLAEGIEKVNGEFTQGQKVLGRYRAIMEDTSKAQGDAKRTAGELAGQQRQLDANLGNLSATLGGFLVGPATGFTGFLNDLLDTSPKAGEQLGNLTQRFRDLEQSAEGATEASEDAVEEFTRITELDIQPIVRFGSETRDLVPALIRAANAAGISRRELRLHLAGIQNNADGIRFLIDEINLSRVAQTQNTASLIAMAVATDKTTGQTEALTESTEESITVISAMADANNLAADAARLAGNQIRGMSAALKSFRENADDIAETRSLGEINKELQKQRRIRRQAAKEGRIADFAKAQAAINELRRERELRRQGKRAVKDFNDRKKAAKAYRDTLNTIPSSISTLVRLNFEGLPKTAQTGLLERGFLPKNHSGGVLKAGQTGIIRQGEALLTPSSRTVVSPADSPQGMNITLKAPDVLVPAASIIGGTGKSLRTGRQRAMVA